MKSDGNQEPVFRQAARRLRAELEAVMIRELGEHGFAGALRAFLVPRLRDGGYRLTRGQVLSSTEDSTAFSHAGLIVDASSFPPVNLDGEAELVPVDTVYGVVEAVDRLDPESLRDAASTVAGLKRLRRRPRYVEPDRIGNSFLGVVVARSGLDGEALLEAVAVENASRPFEEQVDVLCVLDRGIVAYAELDPDGSRAIEMPVEASARLRLSWVDLGEGALLSFYLILWQALGVRRLHTPPFHQILRGLPSAPGITLPLAHGVDLGQ